MRRLWVCVFLVVWASSAGLTGCSSLRVAADHDPSVDFTALRTFSWLPEKPYLLERFPDLTKKVHEEVDRLLAARGFQPASGENADFRLRYDAALDSKLSIQRVNDAFGYSTGPWRYEYNPNPWYRGYSRAYEWDKGTLIIDITDGSGKRLIWRGVAEANLDDYDSPAKRAHVVNRAIVEIMKGFPPK